MSSEKSDLDSRCITRIIAELGRSIRPWVKPWNSEHAVSPVRRANGLPYCRINVLVLRTEAMVPQLRL